MGKNHRNAEDIHNTLLSQYLGMTPMRFQGAVKLVDTSYAEM
jgi:hypothetical protein